MAGGFGGRLNISFNDQIMNQASVVEAVLVNSSSRVLSAADFESPVVVSVLGGNIVDWEILEKQPVDMSIDLLRQNSSTLEFTQGILKGDEQEFVRFRMLIDRADPLLQVNGRIPVDGPRLVQVLSTQDEASGQTTLTSVLFDNDVPRCLGCRNPGGPQCLGYRIKTIVS